MEVVEEFLAICVKWADEDGDLLARTDGLLPMEFKALDVAIEVS
jgi:hypothetical protein